MHTRFHRTKLSAILLVVLAVVACHGDALAQQRGDRPVAFIGIPAEIAPVEAKFETPGVRRIQGFVFTSGTGRGTRLIVARWGVGTGVGDYGRMAKRSALDHSYTSPS